MNPLSLLIVCLLGWMNRHQQLVIEYLQEQLGRRPRFTDDRRRRLAAKGKRVGRKGLMQFASIVTPNTLPQPVLPGELKTALINGWMSLTTMIAVGSAAPTAFGSWACSGA